MVSQFWRLRRSETMVKNKKKKNGRGVKGAGFRRARDAAISGRFHPSNSKQQPRKQLCLVLRFASLENWITVDLDDDLEKKMMTIDPRESNFTNTQNPILQVCSLSSSTSNASMHHHLHHHKIDDSSKEETQNPNFLQKCSLHCCSSCNIADQSHFVHLNMHHPSLRLHSICTMKQKGMGSLHAALGTSFYCMGGLLDGVKPGCPADRLSRKAFLFDTTSTTRPCWKRIAPMRHGRAWGKALAVDGKLYVLGGLYDPRTCGQANSRDWGEIYDPVTDSWTPMADPPQTLSYRGFQAWFDHDSSSILVVSLPVYSPEDSEFLARPSIAFRYLVKKNKWVWVASYSDAPNWCLPSFEKLYRVLVGTTSYWISVCDSLDPPYDPLGGFTRVCAYDFEDKTFFTGPLHMNIQMQKLFYCRDGPYIMHLVGDIFLAFWMQRIDEKDHIQCTKLQIRKCMGNIIVDDKSETYGRYGQLHVTVLSCQTYLPSHDIRFGIEEAMLL